MELDTVKSFPAIINKECVAIILGTMPGKESIAKSQYYAHSNNLFWDIMIRIFEKNFIEEEIFKISYEKRSSILLENKIALWDVIKFCDRKENLDKGIRNAIINDFEAFFCEYNSLKFIFFNGKTPKIYFESKYPNLISNSEMQSFELPSTSPTFQMNCFQKLREWNKIKDIIAFQKLKT